MTRERIDGSVVEHQGTLKRARMVSTPDEPSMAPEMVEILPPELLQVILCCVASCSEGDYRRCRETCKTFYNISQEKAVLQKLCITDYSIWHNELTYWPRGTQFVNLFAENDNPRALYQLGVREFCTRGLVDVGLKKLEKASLLGYTTAKYALGVIKLGGSEAQEGRDEGRRLIAEVKSEVGVCISECRRTLFNRVRCSIFLQDTVTHKYYPPHYTVHDHCHTCCRLAWWADSAFYYGPFEAMDGFPTIEISHMAQCHACEWTLESKVFAECFDLQDH